MTLIEIAVIVFGVFAGYWVVSKLFFPPPKASAQINSAAAPLAPMAPDTLPRWHDILQVSASASATEIRDAYRRLISQYHPDKVDSLGQELKDLAAQKSQAITAAYQEGMRAHGELS